MKKIFCFVLFCFALFCFVLGEKKQRQTFASFRVFGGYPEYINGEFGIIIDIKKNYDGLGGGGSGGLGGGDNFIPFFYVNGIHHGLLTRLNVGYNGNVVNYRGTFAYSPLSGFFTLQFGTGVRYNIVQKFAPLLECQIGVSLFKIKYQVEFQKQEVGAVNLMHYFNIGIGLF